MRKVFFIITFSFFFMAAPFVGNASTFFFLPQNAEHQESETFVKTLYIDTEDQKINTIESKINFNQEVLEAVDIIIGDSVIKLWIEAPTISNKNGTIEFAGGIPNGHSGEGIILKIIFKAKKIGNSDLNLSDTKILLNDGKAAEDKIILLDNDYGVNIIEKSTDFIKITSGSGSNQDEWQNSDTISLHWDLTDEAQYSYILSRDFSTEPDKIPDKPEGELIWMGDMSYEGLEDDIYYFHLRQKLPDKEWSSKITIRTMIDATDPEEFTLQVIDIENKKYLVFSTTDATSGIDRYEVSETGLDWLGNTKPEQTIKWKIAKSPYLLENQNLKSVLKVKAIDKAGNERLSEIILHSGPNFFTEQIIFLLLIITAIISMAIWKLFFKKK